MKYAGPIVRRSVAAVWPRIQRSAIGPSPAPMPRAPYSTPMPAADAAADRKHPLAEDRQQQQHAAGQAPAGLHEHQRRDVRRCRGRSGRPSTRSVMPVSARKPAAAARGAAASRRTASGR